MTHDETAQRVRRIAGVIDKWIDYQTYIREIPGGGVGISVGEETVLSRGSGYADLTERRPVTPDTRFRIASHSKTFTATAIMMLVEQGKLKVDDPITDYLPDYHTAGHVVTIRHLLNHTSGIEIHDHQPFNEDMKKAQNLNDALKI